MIKPMVSDDPYSFTNDSPVYKHMGLKIQLFRCAKTKVYLLLHTRLMAMIHLLEL